MKRVLCLLGVNPQYIQFAVPQLKAILNHSGIPLNILLQDQLKGKKYQHQYDINYEFFTHFPFIILNVPDFQQHRAYFQKAFTQAVTVFKTVLLIAQGDTYQQMFENPDKETIASQCLNQQSKVVCHFQSRGRTIQGDDQVTRIHNVLGSLGIKGKVQFKKPQIKYQLFQQHEWYQGHHNVPCQQTMKHVYFGIQLSCNKIANNKFNSRFQLSPTTADNDLAFLMTNQALVKQGSLVLDPFAGTGGLLIPPASKGAIIFGCDLDIRVLNGYSVGRINKRSPFYSADKKYEIFTPKILLNFDQYGFPYPNIIRIDSTKLDLREGEFFDAIIADPPYGIRAMSRSVAGKKVETQDLEKQEKIQQTQTEKKQEQQQQEELQNEESLKNQEKQQKQQQQQKQTQNQQQSPQTISQQKLRKREKRKYLRQNKKKRNQLLPQQEKQFKKQLMNRLNRQRVDNWDKFDKGKIETTEREKIFAGLLAVAQKYLRKKGRLVFLYPVYEDQTYLKAKSLPKYQGFALVDLSQNKMSKGNSRILVTMQKL